MSSSESTAVAIPTGFNVPPGTGVSWIFVRLYCEPDDFEAVVEQIRQRHEVVLRYRFNSMTGERTPDTEEATWAVDGVDYTLGRRKIYDEPLRPVRDEAAA